MNEVDLFHRLLEKYKYVEPVTQDIRAFIIKSRIKMCSSSLKSVKDFSFIYGMIIRLYFGSRKLGIPLSLGISKFLAGFIIVFIFGLITASIVLVSNYFLFIKKDANIQQNTSEIIEKILPEKEILTHKIKKVNKNVNILSEKDTQTHEEIKFRLGVKKFSGIDIQEEIINKITDSIADELNIEKTEYKVINLRLSSRIKNINRIISGSVDKLGNVYTITVRIIDVENSKILFITSEEINSEKEIPDACKKIAGRILKTVE